MRLILCVIAAEALTQLACKAEIFDSLRNWLRSLSEFTNRLLECPYCVSVWVALFTTALYYYWEYAYLFVIMLVIHRLSDLAHDLCRIVTNFKIDQVLCRMK
jgi:hypothetical protein